MRLSRLLNIMVFVCTLIPQLGSSQYKVYQPGSLQESYALMSNKNAINGFRFYPQTPELIDQICKSKKSTQGGAQLASLPGIRRV